MAAFPDATRQSNAEDAAKDTIFALSSGAPPAGIAVIRLSGPASAAVAVALAGNVPPPRHATLATLRDGTGEPLDRAVLLFFAAPASFTGEDVLELHIHGGRAVLAGVLAAIAGLPGCRLAEPGEFSRRAFLAGRMDLTEAEGLADLIAADTAVQRRLALGQMQGSIRSQYECWRSQLLHVRALIEAELDFGDEEGVAGSWIAAGRPKLERLQADMRAALADADRGRALREGAEIVIAGPVNAGKSSLLNALARRDLAIVSDEAGTTRDVIEVALDLGGYRVVVVDTAGLREVAGAVEREGIRRARERAAAADLVLWLSEHETPPDVVTSAPVWPIRTKTDLHRAAADGARRISTRIGEGIEELLADIRSFLADRLGVGESPVVTRLRHAKALEEAVDSIGQALVAVSAEVVAEHLRLAGDAVGRVTGRFDIDEVLDVVFREFCIGK